MGNSSTSHGGGSSDRFDGIYGVGLGQDILVVDDNDSNFVAFEAALTPLDRKLVYARSGTEALHRLLDQDFALIFLDVAMPGMNGFETAQLIRTRERSRQTPIIFVTGVTWQEDAELHGYELGAFDFLVKPVRAEVLLAKARVFIQLQERTFALHEALAKQHERELETVRRTIQAEAMQHKAEQASELNHRKDEFIALLSHELRNPLQPLQMAVDVLDHIAGQPMPEHLQKTIGRQVHQLTRLVDDLLDVARFTAGKIELHRAPVAISDIVAEAVKTCSSAIETRKQRVVVESESNETVVDGDAARLLQVFTNLIDNATKYTPEGGQIDVTWGCADGQAYARVHDTGRGIRDELLPKVFDMFVQDHIGSGGMGLGLGLVKWIVETHGGSVKATSAGLGQESTFEVQLPLATAPTKDTSPRNRPVELDDRALRIVVCEDSDDVREMLADVLRLRGHDVELTRDGSSAIATVVASRPDVALVDIGLPDIDGYAVARAIREQMGAHRPTLIALTGYGQASDRVRTTEAGFDAHIVKPASADKILVSVRTADHHRQQQNAVTLGDHPKPGHF